MSINYTHFTQTSSNCSPIPNIPSISKILYKLIPNLSYSELKLYLYYVDMLNKQSKSIQSLDITDFCQKTNTSRQSAYSALKSLQDKYLIPINIKFMNTFQITKKRTKKAFGLFEIDFKNGSCIESIDSKPIRSNRK